MNDKIKQLAIQAGAVKSHVEWEADFLKKFANLIIYECCDVVINSDPSEKMVLHEPYSTIMNNIIDYFGEE